MLLTELIPIQKIYFWKFQSINWLGVQKICKIEGSLKREKEQNKWNPLYYVLIVFWDLLLTFLTDLS